jgi:hypothetical protein
VVIKDKMALSNLKEPFQTLSKLASAATSGEGHQRWHPYGEARRNKSHGPAQRTLRAATPYYTRLKKKRRFFSLDEKPTLLKHLDEIEQRAWEQYEAHLKRISALERAEFYQRLMEQKKFRSVCALARSLGKAEEGIRFYLDLLKLPAPILEFLRKNRTPSYVRYLSVKRLRPLLKLGSPRAAWRRFRELVAEADRKAGLWKSK